MRLDNADSKKKKIIGWRGLGGASVARRRCLYLLQVSTITLQGHESCVLMKKRFYTEYKIAEVVGYDDSGLQQVTKMEEVNF